MRNKPIQSNIKKESSQKAISIHQPAYLPWLGYFHKIAMADEFVVLDMTQFEKNSYINRNKILTPNGAIWLTVPIETKGIFKNNFLTETKISNLTSWQKKHWRSIEQNYNKAPFFKEYSDELKKFYRKKYTRINTLCWDMLTYFTTKLGIKTKLIRSSELSNINGEKTSLIINICQQLGAKTYISGKLGKNYLDIKQFDKISIDLIYQKYQHPKYKQIKSNFISNLCILDLLFNVGPQSLDVIMTGQKS